LTAPPFVYSLPHKLGQHRALILTTKGLVERVLDIGRYAKIHSGHSRAPVVEYFNNRMAVTGLAVKTEGSPQQLEKWKGIGPYKPAHLTL
jgi:hypothetical protein